MRKRTKQWCKNLGALACGCLCLCCGAARLGPWAREQGGEAVLLAAGLQAQAAYSSPSPSPGRASPLPLPDDGVVAVGATLPPGASPTPDPSRSWAPVEEVQLGGGTQVADFFVKDSTGSGTDLNQALAEAPSVSLKGDGTPEILIYHTHTSEAYSLSSPGFYYTDMDTRTQEASQSVVAAGEALKEALEAQGFGVVHDTTVNDTLYNGSYERSWDVIQKNLEATPTLRVTIDVHRDSMTTESGVKYKPTVTVEGRKAAQVMLIAGCDADGSWGDFPRWEENLRLALKIQQKMAQLTPGLARPLMFSNSKYNMNATPGSLLLEVGTEVNTVSEARYAGQLAGEAIAQVLREWGGG